MDYIPSVFQFDQSKDHQELFQIISNNFPSKSDLDDDHQIRFEDDHHNHLQAHPLTPSQDGHDDLTNKRRRSSSSSFEQKSIGQEETNPNEKKRKKVTHREIERQRRQEMAALHASLRSLIPLQNLKGNRSISDQMHVAANYIKEMQRKNEELIDKRDELIKLSNNSCSSSTKDTTVNNNNNNSEPLNIIVSVRHSRAGIGVLVNTALKQELSLSRLLQVLVQKGLEVLSCVSVKVNDRFLHTIESEAVGGERHLDLNELEQILKNSIDIV